MAYLEDHVLYSIESGDVDRLHQFLKSGLDPNMIFKHQKGVTGKTILDIAVRDKNIAIVKLLLNFKCDVNLCVQTKTVGENIFYSLCTDDEIKDFSGTALFRAICDCNTLLVEVLLKAGADVNMKCTDNTGVLAHAMHFFEGNSSVIKMLLRTKKCDVNAQDIYGISPLHIAVLHDQPDLARLLLNYRALVNIEQCQGVSPLYICKEFETLKVLLEYGADPNYVSAKTMSPVASLFTVLKRCSNPFVVTGLVEAGIEVTHDTFTRDTSDSIKIKKDDPELFEWLQSLRKEPRSLKIFSALCVRRTLSDVSNGVGLGVKKRVDLLPLPNIIKDYLLMKHI